LERFIYFEKAFFLEMRLMRKIIITNDDGINASGIIRLARAAAKFGSVTVIAPDSQRSAMSHKITLLEPIVAKEVSFPVEGVKAYAVSGTPADCIRIGICNILGEKPDVVLSGINHGFNTGGDTQYSATIGAALEAASQGIRAIAFSEGIDGVTEVSEKYLEDLLGEYIDKELEFNQIWNINFPECTLKDFRGILSDRKVSRHSFYNDSFIEEKLSDGSVKYTTHGAFNELLDEGSDFKAIKEGYISIGKVNNVGW